MFANRVSADYNEVVSEGEEYNDQQDNGNHAKNNR